MKKIKLTQGKYAIVDEEDFVWLNQRKWYFSDGYARRKNGGTPIYMHRLVNKTPEGIRTDHINQNKLDNRKANLRTAHGSINQRNTKIFATNTSGCKGVSWCKNISKWEAYIWKDNKKIGLGYSEDIKEAVKLRSNGERIYW